MLNLDCLQTYKNRDQIGAHLKPVRRQMVISGSANYSLNCTISLIAFNCLRFPNCFHCALVRLLFLFSCYWFACRFYFALLIAFCVTISFCKRCHNSGCPRLLALLLFLIVFYFLSPPGRDLCQHRRLFINKLLQIDWQHARIVPKSLKALCH